MPTPSLEVHLEYVDTVAVVSVRGSVDASTIEELRRALEPLCEQSGIRLVLDCTDLAYVNSLGFGLLFKLSQVCRQQQGRMVLANVRDKLRAVFKILGLEKLVAFYPTTAEALALIGRE